MTDKEIDDGLTDEERAALAEGDEDTGEETNVEGEADEPTGEQADEAGRDDGEAADEGEKDEGEAEDTKETASAPVLVVESPSDADEQLKAISTQKDELNTKYEDGDITAKEYQQQLDDLFKQERAIERAVDRAELAAEMEKQRLVNEWTFTVNAFIDANPVYRENPRLYRALDQEVKDIANSEEGKALSGAKILAKAHENLSEAFNIAKPGKKTPIPKGELPPSLHGVPAADANDVSGGKWAGLDRLANTNPIAYEEALMKMPDSERDAYLASQ